jgi:benzoyl-CoA reductase/2-hydroxyglutaryl-CoA dehydratase subunit BcrC/BadD/HgdB
MENQPKEESIDVQKELQKIIQEREKFRIQMTRKYYLEEVIPAKENGKKVIYTGGGGFGELVYAFDNTVLAIPSDNYAVYTAARRQHRKYLDLVEERGLSPDVCSYDRVAAGLMFTGEGVYGKMPEPDLIIGTSSVCETHAKFWEIVADHYGGTPFFPFYYPIMQTNERMPEYAVEYGKRQVRKALDFIAEHTGQKVDWDRFKEVVKMSVDTITYYWENVIELRTVSPSPWSTMQTMSDTFFLAAYLGRPEAKQYFELVAKEVKFRIKHKIGINPNERFRILYTEIPPWFWVGLLKIFHEKGGTLACECYPTTMWLSVMFDKYNNIEPVYDLDPEKPDEAVLYRVMNTGVVRNQEHMIDELVVATEKYNLDGAVFFTNRSCQLCTRSLPLRERIYRERTGKPTMSFYGEHCDDRTFSESQSMAKIDAFFDTLERRKNHAA